MDDLKAIERLHATDIQAVMENDHATLLSLMHPDAVVMAPGAPAMMGKAEMAEGFEARAREPDPMRVTRYEFHFEEVKVLGTNPLVAEFATGPETSGGGGTTTPAGLALLALIALLRRRNRAITRTG